MDLIWELGDGVARSRGTPYIINFETQILFFLPILIVPMPYMRLIFIILLCWLEKYKDNFFYINFFILNIITQLDNLI